MATVPVFVGNPKAGVIQIVNADGTSSKTAITGGGSGSKVVSLMATSDDSSARVVRVRISRSGTHYIVGAVSIPALSGTDGSAPSVDLINSVSMPGLPLDGDAQHYLFLESGDTLTVALASGAVTSGKTISVTAVYGDF